MLSQVHFWGVWKQGLEECGTNLKEDRLERLCYRGKLSHIHDIKEPSLCDGL
jgi:hypothetical protein